MNDDTFSAAGQSSSVAWTTPAWTSATAATASGTAWVGRTNYRATWHAWSHSSLNARTGSALTGAGTGFPCIYHDILKIHHSHPCRYCDGVTDCDDGSDELFECGCHKTGQFACRDERQCIARLVQKKDQSSIS